MTKKLKIVLIVVLLVVIACFLGFKYILYGGGRDLNTEKAAFTMTSTSIIKEFKTNIESANKKYLEKAVEVSGTITEIDSLNIKLDNALICTLSQIDKHLKIGQKTTIKGRVVGFDELFEEVKLDQCLVVKKTTNE